MASLISMVKANCKYGTQAMRIDVDVTKSFFERSSYFIDDEEEENLTRKAKKLTLETKSGYVLIPMPAKII